MVDLDLFCQPQLRSLHELQHAAPPDQAPADSHVLQTLTERDQLGLPPANPDAWELFESSEDFEDMPAHDKELAWRELAEKKDTGL